MEKFYKPSGARLLIGLKSSYSLLLLFICMIVLVKAQNQEYQFAAPDQPAARFSRRELENYLLKRHGRQTLDSTVQESAKQQAPAASQDVDPTFTGNLTDGLTRVQSVAALPDGKFLVGGLFHFVNDSPKFGLVRLNPNGELDASFNANGAGPDGGGVQKIELLPDGKIIIVGLFTNYNNTARKGIARLNSDGTLDASFNTGVAVNDVYLDAISDAQPLADGKILIAGLFTQFNGIAVNRIARLNQNGSVDATFSAPAIDGSIGNIALQPDGKIIIAGVFSPIGIAVRFRVARLNPNGSLDASFNDGAGPDNFVNTIAVQSDGKILLGGYFINFNNRQSSKIVRLNADGSVDPTFSSAYKVDNESHLFSLVVLPDGRILAGGAFDFDGFNSYVFSGVVRFNSNGNLDTSFRRQIFVHDLNSYGVNSIKLAPGGKIIAGGNFNFIDSLPLNRHVAVFNGDGGGDTNFKANVKGLGGAYSIAVQPDGKIVAGGSFRGANGAGRNNLVRYNADGTIEQSFSVNVDNDVESVVVQPDGKILIAGQFSHVNGIARPGIARLNRNGSLDSSFIAGNSPFALASVKSIVLQPNGKILVGGYILLPGSFEEEYGVARLNSDGSRDADFSLTVNSDSVFDLALAPDGKIYVGGDFQSFGGSNGKGIVRLNPDGSVDSTFNPGGGTNERVFSVKLQPDGKVLIAGNFTSVNNQPASRIARLNSNGSLDSSFGANLTFNNQVLETALLANGQILVGGEFTAVNGTPQNALARLNSNGSLDAGFTVSPNFKVEAIAVQTNGRTLIGGFFTSVDGVARSGIARLLAMRQSFTITGKITNNGFASGGVTVKLTGGATQTQVTDAGGNYRFDNLPADAYVVTPNLEGAVFSPPSRRIDNFLSQTVIADDFAVTPCNYTVSQQPVTDFTGSGGTANFAVNAIPTCSWKTSSAVSWIVILEGAGKIGSSPGRFIVQPNDRATPREGFITVAGETYKIKQEAAAANCSYSLSQTSLVVPAAPGSQVFSFSFNTGAGCRWSAAAPEGDSWIKISSNAAAGAGSGSINFTIDPNPSENEARVGVIKFNGQTFTVNQRPQPFPTCSYQLNPAVLDFASLGGESVFGIVVAITAPNGAPCRVFGISHETNKWIKVLTPGLFGSGPMKFAVEPNAGAAREGIIVVGDAIFTVRQASGQSANCFYSLNSNEQTFAKEGGTGIVSVTTPVACAKNVISSAQWIKILTGADEAGSGSVSYGVEQNPSPSPRTGTITIGGQTYTVKQEAAAAVARRTRFDFDGDGRADHSVFR